jgi:hypothetical protein
MRRWILGAVAVSAAVFVVGCGGPGSTTSAKPAGTVSVSVAPAGAGASVELSKKWSRTLDAADAPGQGVCSDVGSSGCADLLSGVMSAAYGLQDAIDSGHLGRRYPRTSDELQTMGSASDDYTNQGCMGSSTANADGSSCFSDSAAILSGVGLLEANMTTDEITWKMDR